MAAEREPERRARELRELLIAFHASPGRYNIALRQPAALFSSMRQVLQTAIGRGGLQQGDAGDAALRQAACFFVRSALLHPGASHYELMGLPASAEAGAIKDRYRLMMRLLHPDFAAGEPGLWPADTAARINQAYEVLSSPVRRREYDEQFNAPASPPSVPPAAAPRRELVRRPERRKRLSLRHTSRGGMKAIMIGCALLGAGLLAAALIAGHREPEYLVQRSRPAQAAELPGGAVVAAPPRQAPADSEPAPAAQMPAQPPVAMAALTSATDTVTAAAPLPAPAMAGPLPSAQVATASRAALDAPPTATAAPSWPRETAPAPAPAPAAAAAAAEPRHAGPGRLAIGRITEAPEPRVAADVATTQAAAPAPASAPTPARLPVAPGLTLAEAQPLLASLLHGIESGRGEALLNLLEPQARQSATAQALSRQLDGLAGSGGPLRVSAVQFKAEPGDGRLMVTGQMLLDAAPASGAATRRLALRIEFASRAGGVVMTGLSGSAP